MNGQPRRKGSRSRRRKGGAAGGRDFWNSTAPDEIELSPIRLSTDPSAMVRSLGTAPLSGREQVAEHYFAVVYERSANLAAALAATAGLLATDD